MQIYRFGRLFDVAWPALQCHLRAALQEGLTSRSWMRWENWNTDSTDVLSLQVRCLRNLKDSRGSGLSARASCSSGCIYVICLNLGRASACLATLSSSQQMLTTVLLVSSSAQHWLGGRIAVYVHICKCMVPCYEA